MTMTTVWSHPRTKPIDLVARRAMVAMAILGVTLLPAVPVLAQPQTATPAPSSAGKAETTESEPTSTKRVPAWAADARWYHIFVPRFHNGETANDLPSTEAWTARDPVSPQAEQSNASPWQHYGGDLAGVAARLPYLEKLGVNTLYLGSVFDGAKGTVPRMVDMRHINDTFAVPESRSKASHRDSPPSEWVVTESDKVFFEFLNAAHKRGFRVVLEFDTGYRSDRRIPRTFQGKTNLEYVEAVARKWSDPNGDKNPSDGVDGWVISPRSGERDGGAKGFVDMVKKINPDALIVGRGKLNPESAAVIDVVWNERVLGSLSNSLVSTGRMAPRTRTLFDSGKDMAVARPDTPEYGELIGLADEERLLSRCVTPSRSRDKSDAQSAPDARAYARYRLALIVQHLLPGSPVTYYGDEVGLFGATQPLAIAPMWWSDLPDTETKAPHYRGDLFGLVQWLHGFRREHAPVRTGRFRPLMLDERRRILAFARSLPGDDVIVVMNYGDTKQKVMLPAGNPGQLVAVITPHLQGRTMPRFGRGAQPEAPDRSKPLRQQFSGSRQFVNDMGEVRVWVEPMSVRFILVNDREPRR